jgi:RNA polymerase sigma-32 factor
MSPEQVKRVSAALGVTETEVVEMNRRLSGPDRSLNAPLKDEAGGEWQDWLVDPRDDQETSFLESDELVHRRRMLTEAMNVLSARERRVIEARQLADEPATLEVLSTEFGVSRERVRQIEARALQKLEKAVRSAAAVQRDGEQAARLSRLKAGKDEVARS